MTPLPMSVVAGYLGAGKTTLINRVLAADHGLKLMILVNDFGAINIDEGLLASKDEDTIALANGCVCCTMGADLFMALGDALDRQPRPDHLIVEASGVAAPAQIANAALAEPDLDYAGIVTVVDGPAFDELRQDPLIGAQVVQQVAQADLVWISKQPPGGPSPLLDDITRAPILIDGDVSTLLHLVAQAPKTAPDQSPLPTHPRYVAWSCDAPDPMPVDTLRAALAARPEGLFRVKGTICSPDGIWWRVQVVGRQVELTRCDAVLRAALVGIGLAEHVTEDAIEYWWAGHMAAV